jgi:signal transduction histidine kinase
VQRAQRMNRLIDTLHQYTTADAKVRFEPVDMNLMLAEARANLEKPVQERGAKITADNLPTIVGNAPQLIQLLQNLIGNGIKYCDKQGPCIHLAASKQDEDAWLFSVTDNGIGIPLADSKRIFDPFIRAANAAKRDGTGLGLATCKKIVERHSGKIWCESNPNFGSDSGTSFLFTLPAVQSSDDLVLVSDADALGSSDVQSKSGAV